MRRRSGAGGESIRERRRKAAKPKRRDPHKPVSKPVSTSGPIREAEVARLTRELNEAREQQAATAEVLRVISSFADGPDPVFQVILANATRICEARYGNLYLFSDGAFQLVASSAALALERLRGPPIRPTPGTGLGRMVRKRAAVQIADVLADRAYPRDDPLGRAAEREGIRTLLCVPMIKEDELIGAISIFRTEVRPFTGEQIRFVANFAAQAVIAIENSRLLSELRQRTAELTKSLKQQTATSEVLGVISRSKFELQPILQSVADTASRLCRADVSVIFRLESGVYRFAAGYSLDPAYLEHERRTPISPGPGTVVGRAAMSREVVQIEDAWTDPLYEQKAAVKISGGRSMIGVPLMREGEPIGVIGLARTRVEHFTQREIELVTTFADQAVIAIENVRLFEAEQQRTRELTESLEQQTATSKVLQVISSSSGDLQPVFEAVLANATR